MVFMSGDGIGSNTNEKTHSVDEWVFFWYENAPRCQSRGSAGAGGYFDGVNCTFTIFQPLPCLVLTTEKAALASRGCP